MIENSERGITLNKSLAWTIVCGLLGAGTWLGVQTTTAKSGIETVQGQLVEAKAAQKDQLDDQKDQLKDITNRVRSLEGQSARQAVAANHVNSELNEVQQQLRENNQLLRRLLQQTQSNYTR